MKNKCGKPLFSVCAHTESDCQAVPVSQNQICERKHHIQFCCLFSQTSVSRLSVPKQTLDYTEDMLYLGSDG